MDKTRAIMDVIGVTVLVAGVGTLASGIVYKVGRSVNEND